MKIAVIGLWHQGVVGAARLADMGHDIVGADLDTDRVEKLGRGEAPLFEPGLNDLLAKGIGSGRLKFTNNYAAAITDASIVFVMFDTPVDENDASDLSGIFQAIDIMTPALAHEAVIIVTAQVPVGTCDALMARIHAEAPNRSVSIAYMPENLRLGQAIERFRNPALPVIGCDDARTFDRALMVLGPLASEWHQVGLRTGEMLKHALNAYIGLTICFANELGNICDAVGADGKRIGELLRLEPRVGPKAMLSPGLGFSGGTLARDLQTLRRLGREHAVDTPLFDGAWQANAEQNLLVLRKLASVLPNLQNARIAVLGLTYKPDTSTLRRSAAIDVITALVKAGASVRAHDPRVDREELKRYSGFDFREDPLAAVADAEALVLMTPWEHYRNLDFEEVKRRMVGSYVLDTAGLWNAADLTRLGFHYAQIGRGREPAHVLL